MKQELIANILDSMSSTLNTEQLIELKNTLYVCLYNLQISKQTTSITTCERSNQYYMEKFLLSKGSTGLSQNTISNYRLTISMFLNSINKPLNDLKEDDFIFYLETYRKQRKVSYSRIKNMQSALSSFFTWLFKKHYILTNPMAYLDSIKLPKIIKKPFMPEEREIIKFNCNQIRDLALTEFLYSTGVRVSELVSLNRTDINPLTNTVMVMGKGSKEREVYITPNAKVYLDMYLKSRTDNNPALFVSLRKPFNRLSIKGVQAICRRIGDKVGIPKVTPHRFRRTTATNALNRGMPLEQVSILLGHSNLDTTRIYCTVQQESVRLSHQKYLVA